MEHVAVFITCDLTSSCFIIACSEDVNGADLNTVSHGEISDICHADWFWSKSEQFEDDALISDKMHLQRIWT